MLAMSNELSIATDLLPHPIFSFQIERLCVPSPPGERRGTLQFLE